jgi:hypothetical protein
VRGLISARPEAGCSGEVESCDCPGYREVCNRRPPLPEFRRAIALKRISEYGVSLAETVRRMGISTSGVAQILRRSERA